uniref:cytochrome P450 1A1-like n=1 Tax=Myxine glutinosa TaxID=7769 RepID=UPI00358E0E2C
MASALGTSEVWWPSLQSSMLIFSTIFLALVTLHRIVGKRQNGVHSIPGPYPWPIVGNIFQLGKKPHLVFSEMVNKYGEVFSLKIGSRPVVVLNGLDTIKKALVSQGEDFAERPYFKSMELVARGQSFIFNKPYNAEWKAYKRVAQNALRTVCSEEAEISECSCALEQHVWAEARYFVQMCVDLTAEHGAFDPEQHLTGSIGNVISAILFGRRFEHDDKEFINTMHVADDFAKVVASTENRSDFIPILQYLPNFVMRRFNENITTFNSFLERNVLEHYKPNGLTKNNLSNVTDSLIALSKETECDENVNRRISKEQIITTIIDLFGAGFDTVSTTLNWCLLYLVKFPEIQEKIQKEIDAAVDRSNFPRLTDKPNLPYIEAFMLEVFRHSTFLPLAVPHCTTRDVVFEGYFIPRNTCVFVNQWQANHDRNVWKEPERFMPERFIKGDGQIDRVAGNDVLLFGMGKRRCAGEHIARMEVLLFLAIILQQLHIEARPGKVIDLTPTAGLTMKPKHHKLSFIARK